MIEEIYDLTYPQKNIWLVDMSNKNTDICIISGVLKVKNCVYDKDVYTKVMNELVKENDGLRVRIVLKGDEPKQYISKYEKFEVESIDLSGKTKSEISKYLDCEMSKPIDIFNDKLYEFKSIKYSENEGAIMYKLHHVIGDAWSMIELASQFARHFEDNNIESRGQLVVPSYVEYINTETEYTKSEKYSKDKEFWNEYLKDISTPVALKTVSKKITNNSKRYIVKLEKNLNDSINKYCKENRISPYVLFLTALSTYIYRIKENNDFIIGTPVLNRSNFKEKQMLGMFVSTIPMRFKIDENIKFIDLAKQISSDTMSIFRHQKYPYSKILEDVHSKTDIKTNLYNIVLSYQNARASYPDKKKYSAVWAAPNHIQDDLDIHIVDINNEGKLEIYYDYLVDLFDKIEIGYLHTRLIAIIEDEIKNGEKTVEDIRIMSLEEENKILYEFNDTDRDYPKDKTVIDLFEEQVEKTPHNIALVFEDKKMTYKELNEKANQLAHYLREEKNIQPGEVVSLILNRSFEMIIAIIGVIKSGAAYLPIDPEFPENRINYIINDSNSKIIITNIEYDYKFLENLNLKDFNYDIYEKSNLININNLNDLVYIIYTSGTTGKPKGVMISHQNILNLLFAANDVKKLSDFKVALSMSKYFFDMFIIETIVPILLGLEIILLNDEESISPYKILDNIKKYMIEIMFVTPTKLGLMLQDRNNIDMLSSIKKLTVAGEIFNNKLLNILLNKNIDIFNGYGPTEATVCSSIKLIKNSDDVNIGKPIPNTKSFIVDNKNRLLPIGVKGELIISGAGVGLGYLNNDNNISKKFDKILNFKVYKTGDEASYNFNGDLEYNKRIDSQVKINGLRIEIEEIENNINGFEGINSCIVVVKKYLGTDQIIAYITVNNNFLDIDLIMDKLRLLIPKYMLPKRIIKIKEIPLNINGKADRNKLISLKDIEELKNVNSNTKLFIKNEKLSKILLKYNMNDYEYSFNKSIDSLYAIRLSMDISQEFNIDFTIKDIYECENIKELEKKIEYKILNLERGTTFNIPEKKDKYLLTSSQMGIFADYALNPNSILYNTPLEICFENNIDINKLVKSIEAAIINHPILFAKIYVEESKLYFRITSDNIRIKPTKISNSEYINIKEQFVKPFDLLKDRLFNIAVYITDEKINILMDFHHIIFDGQSISIFLKDILDAYNDNEVMKEELSFGQCIEIGTSKEKYFESKKYFLNKFNDELPITFLNTDYPREINKSFKGSKIRKIIDKNFKDRIIEYSNKNGITLNNLFLSTFNLLISKYTYEEDIIVGIATSGREYKQELNTIGMFVKTLPYRVNINLNETIKEYMHRSQKLMLELMENSYYNIEEMIKDLKIKRDTSKNPIFDIMYVFQNFGKPELYINKTKLEINGIDTKTSKFDLTFEVLPNYNEIELNLEYDINLFKASTIERFSEHFINALNFIIDNEGIKVSDVQIISSAEKKKILGTINNTKTDYPKNKSIQNLFEEQVEINQNKIAVVFEGIEVTYKELNEKSNQLANFLINNGLKKGDVVALMIDKSIEMVIGILGILKSGGTYLPIDRDYPKNRIEYILKDANVNLLVDSNTFSNANLYKKYSKSNIDLKNNNSEDSAYIMYTSGTTGEPKGVIVTHKNVIRLVKNTNYIKFIENDRLLQTGSFAFDASTFEFFSSLLNGITLYLIKKEDLLDPTTFKRYLIENKITILWLTSSLFNKMVEYNNTIFKNVRVLLVGGDVLSIKHINLVLDNNSNIVIINGYGPTENTTFSTYYKIEGKYQHNIPIGKPISNSTCYIYDKANNLCPINVPGELYVGGDGVSKGYLNKPGLTKEKFVKKNGQILYKTGDLVYWNSDGNIEFIGRIDTQVKIRGFRIELDEIKQKILQNKNINECVITIFEKDNNKSIICYYTSEFNLDEKKLKITLKNKLPLYMIPNYFIKLDNIPLNVNGKLDKSKLPELKINNLNNNEKIDGIYYELSEAFKEVLNTDYVDINESFFDLGGDSLLVTSLVTKLLSKNINIVYSDIFKYSSVKELGDMINNINTKKSISDDIVNYDYTNINKIIKNNFIENYNGEKQKIGNILLTGVTGFLGAHILDSFMKNESGKIYCLVRSKNDKDAESRLKEILNFFFGNKYNNEFNNRIYIIEGDITNEKIFFDNEGASKIINNVDTVINSAAYVKHFGNLKLFNSINVQGVKNIVNFCEKYNKMLVQISTLSISGNIIEGGQVEQKNIKTQKIFDETKLYIGQNLDNAYAYTKYMADIYILNEIYKNNLNAKIMRVGNLTGRYIDGKFQPNVEENAFANRIRTLVKLGKIPSNLMDFYMEFTPIDFASDAIIKLSRTQKNYNIFHVFNDNHAEMKFIIETLKKINIDIDIINKIEMSELIEKCLNSKELSGDISGIITDINKNRELEYRSNIKVNSNFTKEILNKLDFKWPDIDSEYILKYIKYLKEVKFL